MPLTDDDIAADLRKAGLHFVARVEGEVREPLPKTGGPASCGPEDGRFDSPPVAGDDPDFAEKVNSDWCRMATEYGLLDDDREFLLRVYYDVSNGADPGSWVQVRLDGEWDFIGPETATLRSGFAGLFTRRYVPEFTMLSLDGRAMLNTTVWGNGTVSTIVIRPDRLDGSTT